MHKTNVTMKSENSDLEYEKKTFLSHLPVINIAFTFILFLNLKAFETSKLCGILKNIIILYVTNKKFVPKVPLFIKIGIFGK